MSRKTNTAQYRLIRWWYLMPLVVIPLICLAGITPVQEATETHPAAVEVVQAELLGQLRRVYGSVEQPDEEPTPGLVGQRGPDPSESVEVCV